MKHTLRYFVESLAANPDIGALRSTMQATADAFDLSRFAYLVSLRTSPCDVKLISNYPTSWTDHYLSNNYDLIDPVIARVRHSTEPFEWGGMLWPGRLLAEEDKLMEEASAYGIRCGFTFPLDDTQCRFAALTFAADSCPVSFRRNLDKYREVLELLAILFHREASAVLAPDRCVAGIMLSAREFECVAWAARGKSAWDTSRIIGTSRSTVSFHLENAKKKLDVRTIQQAVALFAASKRR